MGLFKFFFVSFILFIAEVQLGKLPDYIPLCHKSDPKRDECLLNTIEKIKPLLVKGIPKINLLPLEPFEIPEVYVDKSSNSTILRTKVNNMIVTGASNFVLTNIKTDLEDNEMKLQIKLPQINIVCDYESEINVLGVNFKGAGKAESELNNLVATVNMKSSLIEKDGEMYFNLDDVTSHIDIGTGKLKLVESNKKNQPAADSYANLFNSNPKGVYKLTKGLIEETTDILVQKYVSNIFASVSANGFLLP